MWLAIYVNIDGRRVISLVNLDAVASIQLHERHMKISFTDAHQEGYAYENIEAWHFYPAKPLAFLDGELRRRTAQEPELSPALPN